MKSGNISIMLVLIIMLLAILTTAAVAIAFSTTRDTTTLTLGERSLMVAESGAENAILRLLRDPSYAGESGLLIGPGSATIEITGISPKTITSTGVVGTLTRVVKVDVNTSGGLLIPSNWREL